MRALVELLPHLVNGVSLGLLFALMALGFMLIVGVMETINLAHGSLFALGMYFAIFLVTPRLGWFPETQAAYLALPLGTRYAVALLFAPVLVGVFGMALELCMRRTYGKDPLYGLLLTFGAALVIEELIRVVWGSAERQLPVPEPLSGAVLVGDLLYARYRFFAAGFACLMIGLLWFFLEKTPYGSIVKAGAHDSEMVRALGINLSRLRLFVFALGVGLGGDRRRHHGADLGRAAAGRRRCGRSGVPDHRPRRRRQPVGRGGGGAPRRPGRRPHRRLCLRVVADVDVPAVHRRRHVPLARPVRQEEHPRHMSRRAVPKANAAALRAEVSG
jgi:branched-subunit amino acid ABC-type transport system permease component